MIDGCRSGNKTRGGDKNQKRGERMERERGSCIRVRDVCASVRVCGNIYCPAEVGGSDLLLISGEASELCVLWWKWQVCRGRRNTTGYLGKRMATLTT